MREPPKLEYERELRLAVVMYGGVSLAVYINGATQELLHFVRATAPDPFVPGQARFTDAELGSGSSLVYRDLARLQTGRDGRAASPPDPNAPLRLRFVVDILSGTSAGGINAVFLAKALANGQSLGGLSDLWQTEADLSLLINDDESRLGMSGLPKNRNPRSLLNGARMYRKLLAAFAAMNGDDPDPQSLVDEVDLFVTATDLEGLKVRLELGGGEVAEERRYRKSFHLARTRDRNDFTAEDDPFLAFVTRCTSSFPVAFEPMQFAAADGAAIPERWKLHFLEYGDTGSGLEAPARRPFADGGYLDNKPFSYAIDEIVKRRGGASGWVERKVVYIEPDPERLSDEPAPGPEPPDALENVLAVLKVRSYETIRDELLRLRDRNRLVERVWTVVAGLDLDFEAVGPEARDRLATIIAERRKFDERALGEVVRGFGPGYGGYHRLKVAQLTDDMAQMIAAHAGISSDSNEYRAVRFLVSAWRDARFPSAPAVPAGQSPPAGSAIRASEFAFLSAYDLSYRIRRATFVIERINRLRVLTPAELAAELRRYPSICGGPTAEAIAAEVPSELVQAFDGLRERLSVVVRELRATRDGLISPLPEQIRAEIAGRAGAVHGAAARILAEPTDERRRERARALVADGAERDLQAVLLAMQATVTGVVERLSEAARRECHRLLNTDGTPPQGQGVAPANAPQVAQFIARHYYTWFELYDSMLFSITHGTEVGEEIATVEPIRISPLTVRDSEGRGVAVPGLMPAGVAVGHFGAFLSAEWRARDILIGRMNAAEKLIRAALAGSEANRPELADDYVRRAHRAILEEECARDQSLAGAPLAAVRSLASPEARLEYVSSGRLLPSELPPADVVGWIARSAKVMGRVFLEASERPKVKKLASALLYVGHILTGMLEVVVPHRWWGLILQSWIPRVLVFALALIVLGPLLGKDQVSGLGWTTLFLGLGVMVATFLLRRVIKGEGLWIVRAGTSLVAAAVVVVVVIGIVYFPDAIEAIGARLGAMLGR